MKRLLLIILSVLFIGTVCPGLAQAESADTEKVKEVNFVFLHGMGGNAGALQLLADSIEAQLPAYIKNYEFVNPDIKIQTDMLLRSYPNDVDIETWANNIADAINKHFENKENLVLIGHSMGGKAALYAVSHNIDNLADKVSTVVTINSPIKSLVNCYYVGGDTALDYWCAQMLISSQGVLESLVNYDSSQDGKWVSSNKHWLAFISSESSPLSSQFNVRGIDALPRDVDDSIVPISGQYSDGADVVYYGQYSHGDFTKLEEVSNFMADQILRYIFGGNVECSVFARGGAFERKAGFLPGMDYWQDLVAGVLESSGTVIHKNNSYFKWQEWQDIVGESSKGNIRSSFQTNQKNSFPILTGIKQSEWLNPDDPQDGRIYLITRAAPRSSVRVDWSVYQQGLLPLGIKRDHYEVELETGTQLTSIVQVSWETDDLHDLRLRIWSQAQSPFRWLRAQWRVYYKESRQIKIIDSFPVKTLSE
ncbi:MAG: alpha/beta hydrolase [Dehalococcoidales bacterium]|nr:alpha/beta hydrolase [Dehalococcoidales bacterium]